jgi:diguanylate cyclase (GGDEF)-like protein
MAKDGRRIDVSISMAPIKDDAGAVVGAVAVTRDISQRVATEQRLEAANRRNEALLDELRRLNQELAEQARRDPLTGVGNRLRLEEDLAAYDARRVRYGSSYCVLLCDIDRFKALNDADGHQAGDEVLCAVARTLSTQSRAGDGVYRYGGEEFLILLAEQTVEGGLVAGERMRRAVEADGLVTISVGIARCPEGESTDPDDAIRRADRALYAAKSTGRNRVVADG